MKPAIYLPLTNGVLQFALDRRNMGLRIKLLGSFAVWRGKKPIGEDEWPTKKSKALLKILLTNPGFRFTTDEIEKWLWPEFDHDRAYNNLKVTVTQLRKVLEPNLKQPRKSSFVKQASEGYLLSPEDCEIDTKQFEDLCYQAKRERDQRKAIAPLQQAVKLYSSGFLPEDVHEEWVQLCHNKLESMFLEAIYELTSLLRKSLKVQEAINYAEQGLLLSPLNEELFRILIECHRDQGNPGLALSTYERCQRIMAQQDLELSPETESLFQSILSKLSKNPDPTPQLQEERENLEQKLKEASTPKEKVQLHLQLGELWEKLKDHEQRQINLETALQLAQETADVELTAIAHSHLITHYEKTGNRKLAEESGLIALEMFEKKVKNPIEHARLMITMGTVAMNQQQYQLAEDKYRQVSEILLGLTTREAELLKIKAWSNFGLVKSRQDQYKEALSYYDKALRATWVINDFALEASLLQLLGSLFFKWDHLSEARIHWERAQSLAHRIGDFGRESQCLNNLAIALDLEGQLQESLQLHERSIEIQKSLKYFRGLAENYNNIAAIYEILGVMDKALHAYKEAERYDDLDGNSLGKAMNQANIAGIYTEWGQFDLAEKLLKSSIAVFEKHNNQWWQIQALSRLGYLYQEKKDHKSALSVLQEGEKLATELEHDQLKMTILARLMKSYLATGNTKAAKQYAQHGSELAERATPGDYMFDCHFSLYEGFNQLGQKKKAHHHLDLAYHLVKEYESKLKDPKLRASFLSYRRKIIEAWESSRE